MMLLTIVAMAQAAVPPVLGTLPKQSLPDKGCAAYLWAVQDQRFVAMVEPGRLRVMLDGKQADLPAAEAGGTPRWGWRARPVMPGRASPPRWT